MEYFLGFINFFEQTESPPPPPFPFFPTPPFFSLMISSQPVVAEDYLNIAEVKKECENTYTYITQKDVGDEFHRVFSTSSKSLKQIFVGMIPCVCSMHLGCHTQTALQGI